MSDTFREFSDRVRDLLEPVAAGKGYNVTGADGPNELFDFVHGIAGGNGHALGEIIYKVRRFSSNGDIKDIEKIAAWAFLVWRKHLQGIPESGAGPGAGVLLEWPVSYRELTNRTGPSVVPEKKR